MRKISQFFIIVTIGIVLVTICGLLLLKQFNNTAKEEIEVEQPTTRMSQEEFINKIAPIAQDIADEYGLYASVMIAQATLESDSGNSDLASYPNYNLFGMKGKYLGNSVTYPTQEDDGEGNMTTIEAKFRKYPSYEASMTDYAKLLVNGTSWNNEYYKKAFVSNTKTYKDATKALTGKYATDSQYNVKLNAMIEHFKLNAYDN